MKKTAILFYLASAMAATAHSGHDAVWPAQSAAHWALSPLHGLGIIGLAALALLALQWHRKGAGHE